ncbi:MAG: CDP-alcohol phosphatidyltransferase family protein [Proteobacteria bacterium]|nr:CDP-alcohol phosphatidyltransferase family protein [Pseudomonadota bacterium]MBU1612130.1 CDP-alcohol phosphatidyltransferase family protein [Pseudomonadota bacterium]
MSRKDSNLTIPNILTIIRILLTPGFVMAYSDQRFDLAWALFAVAGLTDALDGFLARVLKQRSWLGAILDPLADKILIDTSYICLALNGWIPPWLSVMVVSRDVIIVGGLALLNFLGVQVDKKIQPSWASKATTLFQILLVLFVMLQQSLDLSYPSAFWSLATLTAILTIVSGADYVRLGFSYLPEEEKTEV